MTKWQMEFNTDKVMHMGKTNLNFRYTIMGSEKLPLRNENWSYNVQFCENVSAALCLGQKIRKLKVGNKTETVLVKTEIHLQVKKS